MASWGKCDFKELEKLRDNIKRISGSEIDKFCKDCAKKLAVRLLRNVVEKTPKKSGTLCRGWTVQMPSSRGRESPAQPGNGGKIEIMHIGDSYVIDIVNSVEYALI